MICETTVMLFYQYPRPVHLIFGSSKVTKLTAKNPIHLFRIIQKYNGVAEVHTPLHTSESVVNKVVFDIDGETLEESFTEACQLIDALRNEGLPYVPVYTGGKGFHIYVPVEPFTSNPETVRRVMVSFQTYLIEKSRIKSYDRRVIGSPTHTIRVPLTKRLIVLNSLLVPHVITRWSVYLPSDFCSLTISEILEMSHNPVCRSYDFRELPDIREYSGYHPSWLRSPEPSPFNCRDLPTSLRVLSRLVRPCIFKNVRSPDADHDSRTYFVMELAWLGLSEDTIVNYCRLMGWSDYDEYVTRYHVRRIITKVRESRLLPPACSTLKIKGYCLGESCPYYPGVFYWWGHL